MRILVTILLVIINSYTLKAQGILSFIDSIMLKNQIPEIGFSVISADSILELKTIGFHKIDLKSKQDRANENDFFHLGSNTKAITGFAAAILVEDKKIQWNTKFFDLFPKWKKNSNPAYFDITLADLLSHRAKIQPYTSGLEFQELPDFKGEKYEQRRQFAKYLLHEKSVKNNGKLYNYSNAGYSLAALMLEKVSGKSWENLVTEIMKERVNAEIHFSWPNKININQPYGHWVENNKLVALGPEFDYNLDLGEPAGDICMNLPDYSKFIQLNLQGLLGKDTVLKAATYNFLHFGLKEYAIGWGNVNDVGKKISEHSGSAGTFFCYTLLDVDKKLAFIMVANSATQKTQESIFKILALLRKKYSR